MSAHKAPLLDGPGYQPYAGYADLDHDVSTEGPLEGGSGLGVTGNLEGFDVPGTWIGRLTNWLWPFRDKVEHVRINHWFSASERERLGAYESIDYFPANSQKYREWLNRQPVGRGWDVALMMAIIGIAVGGLGYLLYVTIDLISDARLAITRHLLSAGYAFFAWFFRVFTSVVLAGAASALVVYWAPPASGSGVPDVMAYLNGVHMPKVFNIVTLCAKFVSCALSVASGLPVGPEGPMIHMGAAVGASLSQAHSRTLGFDLGIFRRFRTTRAKRDFTSAGAAVGVATAFHAPLGGLLFASEEVASFWETGAQWRVLVACILSVLTLDVLRSAESSLSEDGHFGLFDRTVTFQISERLVDHMLTIFPALVVGVVAGLLSVAFTYANMAFMKLRDRTWGKKRKHLVAEVMILAAIFASGCFILPLLFPCANADCVVYHDESGVLAHECFGVEHPNSFVEVTSELYTCNPVDHNSEVPGIQGVTNSTSYNELATLMSVNGEDGIKHLFSRRTHRQFGYASLLVMLVWYFTGALIAAGSAISSGLFVPMLMIGAVAGRLLGVLTVDLAAAAGGGSEGAPPGVFLSPSPWEWIDPGAFALIGAAAFMGGVTRLSVALVAIMMEMSADVNMLVPIAAAVLAAKTVADAFCHPLYNHILNYKCVPFLEPYATSRKSLDLIPVRYIMKTSVVTLPERVPLVELQRVLSGTLHSGFPVVRHTPVGDVYVGLMLRDHAMVILNAATQGHGALAALQYADLNHTAVAPVTGLSTDVLRRGGATVEMNSLPGGAGESRRAVITEQPSIDDGGTFHLDLGPFLSGSGVAVHETFSAERAYVMFRTMGLRHMVVIDELNRIKGMVTRKDLLGFRLDEALARADVTHGLMGPPPSSVHASGTVTPQR